MKFDVKASLCKTTIMVWYFMQVHIVTTVCCDKEAGFSYFTQKCKFSIADSHTAVCAFLRETGIVNAV